MHLHMHYPPILASMGLGRGAILLQVGHLTISKTSQSGRSRFLHIVRKWWGVYHKLTGCDAFALIAAGDASI